MKPRFILSPEAARDIREIWSYIADDSIRAARRVRLQLFGACRRLAGNPLIGHSREDLTATIRGRDLSRLFESCMAHGMLRPCRSANCSALRFHSRLFASICG